MIPMLLMPMTIFSSWPSLQLLRARQNQLQGPIPNAVVCWTSVARLDLEMNALSGQIPDAVSSWTSITHLKLAKNALSGQIPDAVSSWTVLRTAGLHANAKLPGQRGKLFGTLPNAMGEMTSLCDIGMDDHRLSGTIPDSFSSVRAIETWGISFNQLSGAIPNAFGCMSRLWHLYSRYNKLCGMMPHAVSLGAGLHKLTRIVLSYNALSGPFLEGIAALRALQGIELQVNKLSGHIPDALASLDELSDLQLRFNSLAGAIPEAIRGMQRTMRILRLGHNKLSGSVPTSLTCMSSLVDLTFESNKFSGSISDLYLSIHRGPLQKLHVRLNDNRLTGSLPRFSTIVNIWSSSANLLEGGLPKQPHPSIYYLDISGRAGGQTEAGGTLKGPVPASMNRATKLEWLLASHQDCEGVIPAFERTLSALVLHGNHLKTIKGVKLRTDGRSMVILCNNLLSCHLPNGSGASANLSLCGLGNQLRHPNKAFPEWVSPLERDGLFWVPANENRPLLFKLTGAMVFLLAVAAKAVKGARLLQVLSRWFGVSGRHARLALSFSKPLSCLAVAVLIHVMFFNVLLLWDRFDCPRTLALASACWRDKQSTHMLIVLFWGHLCFMSPAGECLRCIDKRHHEASERKAARSCLWWFVFTLLIFIFSIPSFPCLAGMSIPGFFQGNKTWAFVVNTSAGIVQGFLGSVVMPLLVRKFTSDEHALIAVANLLSNVLFPAILILYLDSNCLGNWVSFWGPCSKHGEQFQQMLMCDVRAIVCKQLSIRFKDTNIDWVAVEALNKRDICDPKAATARTTLARCSELALLRLQDIWLAKFITSGVLWPAFQMTRGAKVISGELVGKFAVQLAFAILTCGYLPPIMLVLLIAMGSHTLLAALCLDAGNLNMVGRHNDIATPTIVMARALSTIMNLVAVSRDQISMALASAFIMSYAASGRASGRSADRH